MSLSRLVVGIVSVVLIVLGTGAVFGQEYPNKPIRISTGAIGGGGDFDSRQIAQGISGPLGQPVIVDNRTNAPETVSKAPPDGYSLLLIGGSFWTSPLLRKVAYDVERDFTPISLVERTVNVVAVHPSLPVKSVKDLVALVKVRPGELNYSSGVTGGSAHLITELFNHMGGVKMVHVPYKGNAPAITAVISGEVQLTINDAGLLAPHVKSGKLRALAVTSAEPSALAPGLPTVAATGLPGYEAIGMSGMWAPARTPTAIINRLNLEIVRFVNRPDAKEGFLNAGVETVGSSPEQFLTAVRADVSRMAKVIKDAGINVD